MKRIGILLLALLLCAELCGCDAGIAEPTQSTQTEEAYLLPEGTYALRQDIEVLLIAAVGYDRETGESRITSGQLLVKGPHGQTDVLILPKDTRVWLEFYEGETPVNTKYGSLSLAYAAGDPAGKGVEETVNAVSRLLCGVKIDRYVLLNAVQLDLLAEQTEGVYVQVEEDLPSCGIYSGYQNLASVMQEYSSYSYLSDFDGVVFNGTDRDKLYRHNLLLSAMQRALKLETEGKAEEEQLALAQAMISCVTTNLSPEEWLGWLEVSLSEGELLKGSHQESETESLWLYDTDFLNDWVLSHFYTAES